MAKRIRDFLGLSKEGEKWKEEHRNYYLDDVVENDPRKVCPRCNYREIRSLHTHNVDGIDYECINCKLTFSILYFSNPREEIGH